MGEPRDGTFEWVCDGRAVPVGVTRAGRGPAALLLPALSSISTRDEMAPLAARLATRFATVALDWPGFGTGPKPSLALGPAMLWRFLDAALAALAPEARIVVAAGHAAGYLLDSAAHRPGRGRALILVAPTWRGPLPTMLGRRPALLGRLARAGDLPGLGTLLYRANVNPPMVRLMTRAHVYSDPVFLEGARGAGKRAVTRARGARHAAIRFVTGELDPFRDRAAMLAAASAVPDPILAIWGAETPPKSRAEMEALAELPGVSRGVLPRGKLGIHEEFPDAVADAIAAFLDRGVAAAPVSSEPTAP